MKNYFDPVRVYLVMMATFAFALALAYTLQGLYFVQAGLQPFALLLIGAALELSVLLLEIPTGVVADVYSRRRSVVWGFATLGAGMCMVGLWTELWWLLLAQAVSAAGYALLSGAQQAWLADEVGESEAARLYLLGSQYARVAGIVGIAMATLLGSLIHLGAPLLAGGAVLLSLSLWLSWHMPENGFKAVPPSERETWASLRGTLTAGLGEVRRSAVLTFLLAAGLIYSASGEAYDRLSEYLLVLEVGLPAVGNLPPETSAALLFAGLALLARVMGFAVTEPLRRALDPANAQSAARSVQFVIGLSVGALLAFAYAPSFWWAAAASVAFGVLRSLYEPLYAAWLNQGLNPKTRATVNSLASQSDALGQVMFGPLFGAAGSVWGVRAALVTAALLRLPMLAVIKRATKRP